MQDMIFAYQEKKIWDYSRKIRVDDIKDYNISAKNPNKIKEIPHRNPPEILKDIESGQESIQDSFQLLKKSFS
jgi:type I restriction enzyme M protein